MPGVPPDALAQVKKGLRGLFSRKKSKSSASEPSTASKTSENKNATPSKDGQASAKQEAGSAPSQASKAAASAASAGATGGASTSEPLSPQIAEPSKVQEAKDIDINPNTTDTTGILTDESKPVEKSETTAKEPKANADSLPPPVETKKPAEGMSATSGPMDDSLDIEHGFKGKGDEPSPPIEASKGEAEGGDEAKGAEEVKSEGNSKGKEDAKDGDEAKEEAPTAQEDAPKEEETEKKPETETAS